MALEVRSQRHFFQRLGRVESMLAGILLLALPAAGQALHVERVGGGTELVLVTLPLSEATTVAWPLADGSVTSMTSGGLTVLADLAQMLEGLEEAPPVVVVVGGVQPKELRPVLSIGLGERRPMQWTPESVPLIEGGVDRRLGAPGSEAQLRLEMMLPAPDDWRRSPLEVLWELMPALLGPQLPGVMARVDGDLARIESRIDAEVADLELRRLRLQLARIAADPKIDSEAVNAARRRLQVRRKALLGIHPEAAEIVARLWIQGGGTAVQEYLFGVEGVTVDRVADAARRWLPQHPGHAVLRLPPRVFNPRFAADPQRVQLANDAVAMVLERDTAGLSALCLQPVLLPDLDGQLSGTVLARLAAEIRVSAGVPGWVRVARRPPVLELAAPDDGFAELVEELQSAVELVARDDVPFADQNPDARRRALQLMATLLGLAEDVGLSPAELLQPRNLALGVVAPDGETAIEALQKFQIGGSADQAFTQGRALSTVPRLREAAPGRESALVMALDVISIGSPVTPAVVGALVEERTRQLVEGAEVEVLSPIVPGRNMVLLVVVAEATLDELERRLEAAWPEIVGPVSGDELAPVGRRVAADVTVDMSGPVGHARRCAAVAAGSVYWRLPSDLQMEALTLSPEVVTGLLAAFGSWQDVQTTGAGVLPIPDSESP
jgi:hypothetical protein